MKRSSLLFLVVTLFVLSWSRGYVALKKVNDGMLTVHAGVVAVTKNSRQYQAVIVRTLGQKDAGKLSLRWYGHHPKLVVGQRWRLVIKQSALSMKNNYDRYLMSQGVQGRGYIKSGVLLPSPALSKFKLSLWRQRLNGAVQEALPNNVLSGVISALTVGERQNITSQQWRVFQATGTSHLVAISGLHIGLVAFLLSTLCCLIRLLKPSLLLRLPYQSWKMLFGLCGGFFYSALAGFSIPTQRAMIMLAVLVVIHFYRRNLSLFTGWVVALLIVFIHNPFAIFSAGFWLSFSAVGVILYVVQYRHIHGHCFVKSLRIQSMISLGLMPLSLLVFNQVSVSGLIVNLLAIPWVSFLVVPFCLLAVLLHIISHSIAAMSWQIAAWLMRPLWHLMQWAADWHLSCLKITSLSIGKFLIMMCEVFWLLTPRGIPAKTLVFYLLVGQVCVKVMAA